MIWYNTETLSFQGRRASQDNFVMTTQNQLITNKQLGTGWTIQAAVNIDETAAYLANAVGTRMLSFLSHATATATVLTAAGDLRINGANGLLDSGGTPRLLLGTINVLTGDLKLLANTIRDSDGVARLILSSLVPHLKINGTLQIAPASAGLFDLHINVPSGTSRLRYDTADIRASANTGFGFGDASGLAYSFGLFQGDFYAYSDIAGAFLFRASTAGGWRFISPAVLIGADAAPEAGFALELRDDFLLGAFFQELREITDPAAPGTNGARLFARDNGAGKTQLAVRFPTGAVQVLATEP